jgi:hypothetical protein
LFSITSNLSFFQIEKKYVQLMLTAIRREAAGGMPLDAVQT